MAERPEKVREAFAKTNDAREWVLHVASGIGKAGGPPSSSEYIDSLDALKATAEYVATIEQYLDSCEARIAELERERKEIINDLTEMFRLKDEAGHFALGDCEDRLAALTERREG